MRGYHSLTHTLTHYPLTSRYMPSMCDYQFSIVSSIRVDFDKFQLGGSTVLNHLWWCLTNTSLGSQNFCFLPLPSPKSAQYTVHFAPHVRTDAVGYTLTLNPGLINWGGNLCWHIVLSLCCTTRTALLFHYALKVSCLLVRGPNILMNKASSLWNNCYRFDQVFFKKFLYE